MKLLLTSLLPLLLLLPLAALCGDVRAFVTRPLDGARVFEVAVADAAARARTPASASASASATSAEGALMFEHALPDPDAEGPHPRDHLFLVAPDGAETLLDVDALPALPSELVSLMHAEVSGEPAADGRSLRVTRLAARHTVDSLEANPAAAVHAFSDGRRVHAMDYSANAKGSFSFSPVVVMLNFNGGSLTHSCGTKANLLDLFWDGDRNVAGAFDNFSKGRAFMEKGADYATARVLGPYDTDFTASSCDANYVSWANYAAAKAVEEGLDLRNFGTVITVTPPLSGCGWLGRASLTTCTTGRSGSSTRTTCRAVMQSCTNFVAAHEIGHNLNLHHSADDPPDTQVLDPSDIYQPYRDHSCLMGNRFVWNSLNAVKLVEKAWIHEDRVLFLSSDTPFSGTVNLSPLDLYADDAPDYQVVAFTDSAPGVSPVKTYYFSMRLAQGYTAELQTRYLDHVAVHTGSSSQRFSFYVRSLETAKETTESGWTFEEVSFTQGVSAVIRVTAPEGGGGSAYEWVAGAWSGCSVTCGAGTIARAVSCRAVGTGEAAADSACAAAGTKPAATAACDAGECPGTYEWRTGAYGECSVTCGTGVRSREVECVNADTGAAASSGNCEPEPRPSSAASCFAGACPPVTYSWVVGDFTACSAECGSGTQTRSVSCRRDSDGAAASDSACDAASRPDSSRSCSAGACQGDDDTHSWYYGAWSRCSAECGDGTRLRAVMCLRDSDLAPAEGGDAACEGQPRPASEAACSADAECEQERFAWSVRAWGACTAECGGGNRTREVSCRSADTGLSAAAESACAGAGPRPAAVEACGEEPCRGALCDAAADAACGAPSGGRCGTTEGNETACVCAAGYAGEACEEAPGVSEVSLEYDADADLELAVLWLSTGGVDEVTLLLHYRPDAASPWDALPVSVAARVPSSAAAAPNEYRFAATALAGTGGGLYEAEVRFSAAVAARSASPLELAFEDDCAVLRCENGSPCVEGACRCEAGFEGDLCERAVADPCDGVPCMNGARCDAGACNCSVVTAYGGPFTGQYCDLSPDCDLRCDNGGAVDACVRCECVGEWGGDACGECGLQGRCARGQPDGACEKCACAPGYTGDLCERAFRDLVVAPFPASLAAVSAARLDELGTTVEGEIEALLGIDAGRVLFRGVERGGGGGAELTFRLIGLPPDTTEAAAEEEEGQGEAGRAPLAVQSVADAPATAFAAAEAELDELAELLRAELASESSLAYSGAVLGLLPAGEAVVTEASSSGGSSGSGISVGVAVAVALVAVVVVAAVVGAAVFSKRRGARSGGEGAFRSARPKKSVPVSISNTGAAFSSSQSAAVGYHGRGGAAAQQRGEPEPGAYEGAVYSTTAAPAGAAPPLPPRPLPAGWTEHLDEDSGAPYWWNEITGQSTWERPE